MLKIFIDFSPEVKDEHVTNNIRVLTNTEKTTLDDLVTALGVCVAMRRTSTILDSMCIEINKNDVKIIPTNKNFDPVEIENANFVPPEMIPYSHQFFKDLRLDIQSGMQDHLNLGEKPEIKKDKKARGVISKPNQVNVHKRWNKKK